MELAASDLSRSALPPRRCNGCTRAGELARVMSSVINLSPNDCRDGASRISPPRKTIVCSSLDFYWQRKTAHLPRDKENFKVFQRAGLRLMQQRLVLVHLRSSSTGIFLRAYVLCPCPLRCSRGALAPRDPRWPGSLLPMPTNSDAGMTRRVYVGCAWRQAVAHVPERLL